MRERMLAGKVEAVGSDTTLLKYRTISLKSDKGIFKRGEGLGILHIVSSNITKFEECSQCAHHPLRNMALNRGQIDLYTCSLLDSIVYTKTENLPSLKLLNRPRSIA